MQSTWQFLTTINMGKLTISIYSHRHRGCLSIVGNDTEVSWPAAGMTAWETTPPLCVCSAELSSDFVHSSELIWRHLGRLIAHLLPHPWWKCNAICPHKTNLHRKNTVSFLADVSKYDRKKVTYYVYRIWENNNLRLREKCCGTGPSLKPSMLVLLNLGLFLRAPY